MRRISITEQFTGFDGKVLNPDNKQFRVKDALLNLIGLAESNDGQEAIRYVNLGVNLHNSTKEFTFDDEDRSLLLRAIDQNQPKYIVMVIAKLTQLIMHAEAFQK